MPEFRNRSEQYPAIGALGKTLKKVDDFARKPFGYDNPPAAMISDFLDIPGIYKTAENINYGSPLTRGTGLARQMTDDTKAGLFGAMNFAPGVSALAKAAKPMVKAAAPYAARHAVNVAEKYGVSPTMNIVKPEGNLNFRHSVIAESLKGPEKQKVSDFIKQIKGMQGLTKEGKRNALEILEHSVDPNTVVTKQFIEDSFRPSQYSKIDLAGAAEDAELHMDVEATERALRDPERFHMLADELGLEYDDPNIAGELERLYDKVKIHQIERGGVGDSERFLRDVSPTIRDALTNSGLIGNGHFDHRGFTNAVDEVTTMLADTHLEFLRENHVPTTEYQYGEYQRLNPDIRVGNYVEMGVSHPDAPDMYGHYPEASEPMVAHFRGTGNAEQASLPGTEAVRIGDTVYNDQRSLDLDPNSFLIEELQSDAQKHTKQTGPLHQAHATAFKAAVQHALEQGHDTVYLPTSHMIAHARGKEASSFAPIYDQEVVNYGLAPLSRIPGVSVEPINVDDITAYHKMKFNPEAIEELLSGKGQAFPGFAGGGAVDMKEGGKPERTEDRQSFRATPRSGTLGKIADATKYLHENFLKAQAGYSNPVTDAISNLAGVPAFAEMMDRLSYGDSMFKGKGETLKLQDWAVDGLSSVPAGVATNLGIKVVKSIPGALKHGATSFAKASAGTTSNVVRPRGSQNVDMGLNLDFDNFISRPNAASTRERLANFEKLLAENPTFPGSEELPLLISRIKNDLAVDDWVNSTLAKYMKRDLGTPEDPVRKLAEEGITHTNLGPQYETPSVMTAHTRRFRGYPAEGMATSPQALRWETAADDALADTYVTGGQNLMNPFSIRRQEIPEWYKNLPEGTTVYEPRTTNLGLDHIVDVLHEDLMAGRLRPDQVSKISMSDAVRRAHQYNIERAAKLDASKAAQRAGLPVHKEYGSGYKWIELNKPGSFAAESDAMGHSVRGYEPPKDHPDWTELSGGYGYSGYGHGGWDAIKSGKAKVHSLVDEKGHPHVTVESFTPEIKTWDDVTRLVGRGKAKELWDEFGSTYRTTTPDKSTGPDPTSEAIREFLVSKGIDPTQNRVISQIKGKQNARPVDDYQPYVADFVRTGDFHPVIGDAHHTDLVLIGDKSIRESELKEIADQTGFDLEYARGRGGKNYFNDLLRKDPNVLSDSDRSMLDAIREYTPPEMKDGGSVNLRSHYLGSPMMQVGHRIGSRAIETPAEGEEEMPEMPKNPTPEQNAAFTNKINEYFKKQADKKYWENRGPNSADERESRFGELIQSDDPINIEVPPKFGVTSIPLVPEPEEIEEKKSNRFYADGGTVNLRAHYLGY